ncbi:hypothetical protein FOA52_014244 [Chlamydomonas sp. UWO 241]|nr:hypothetical protein FOA52_014244 [Chlamydomonas sp. UWO 241]
MMLQRTAPRVGPASRAARSVSGLVATPRLRSGRPLRLTTLLLANKDGKVALDASIDEELAMTSGEFCGIGLDGRKIPKRTVGEMETEFLEALSSYYFEGKAALTDAEFETLREELIWNGSTVAVLDSDEMRFLEARLAYARGKPIISDEAFDELRMKLKTSASVVTAQGPRCSIRSRKLYSDAQFDAIRMTLLNLPAVLLVLGFVFAIDDVTGFEVTQALELPPPWGVVLLWGVLLPSLYVLSTALTNIGFKDGLILKGNCPECGTENYTYFGDLLTVPGNRGTNVVECGNCKAGLTFDQNKRIVMVDETSEDRLTKAAAAAAKKAASAAKKNKPPPPPEA